MSMQPDRRDFLKTSTAAAAATTLPSVLTAARQTRSPNGEIGIAIVGTGGRGTGAVRDNMTANGNTALVAVADLSGDKAAERVNMLRKNKKIGDRIHVQKKDIYSGLEGYKKILARPDVDVVLFATPPGFRPGHVKEAVEARKHVFAEKPVCVDPAGYRTCIEAHDLAVKNGTAIVTGTQYRRQQSFIDSIKKLHDGMLGKIVAMTARYCSSGIWYRKREPQMTDMEYQIHNWMHFIWLSGDQIAEQAVHNVDVMNWVMKGHPTSCYASGGRFFRPADSEMWDTMSVDYVYPGQKMVSFKCRQLPQTNGDNDNVVYCEGGVAVIKSFSSGAVFYDADGTRIFKTKGNIGAAYRQEHKELIDSVVAGKPIVELRQTADSSLTAVMGRMSAYTGRKVDWDFVAKESKLDLFPKVMKMDAKIVSPGAAQPGQTKLI